MNIGVGSILTKGLGGPACNLLTFGPVRLYISPYDTPSPTPTPVVPPLGSGSSHYNGYMHQRDDEDDDREEKFKLTFKVKILSKELEKSFIVDSFKKDKIVKRVGKINILNIKFKTAFNKMKNRFTVKWKK